MPWFGFGKKKEHKNAPMDMLQFDDGSIILVPTGYRPTQADLEKTAHMSHTSSPGEGSRAGLFSYTASPLDENVLQEYQSRWQQQQMDLSQQPRIPSQQPRNPSQQPRSSSQYQYGSLRNSTTMGGTQRMMGGYATDQPQFFMQGNGRGPGMPGLNPNAFNGGPGGSRGHPGGGNGSRRQGGARASQSDFSQNQSPYSQRPRGQRK
jgi:hypothetical protein